MLLYNFMIILSFIFILSSHPMSMGFTLLVQTLLMALVTGLMTINFWFSYILFLIMVGGLMVLFIYMTSIASNEKFKTSKLMISSMTMAILSPIMIPLTPLNLQLEFLSNELMQVKTNSNSLNNYLNKFISFPSMWTYLMIISYLLIALIAIIKISELKHGPLRKN
uniref:NADH-ubiquinone oxidoreductase chain 6 n=1 Tax=Elateroidea sp. BMNH 1274729 TaxID=1796501 RepID=A0A126TGG4_9COLE|nr:NADH dehydrogenase subunit 6 [Elateroidea sp. BMNH 1274729]